jgi:hypothetical protein
MKIAMSVDTRTCFPTSSTDMPAISWSFLFNKSLKCSSVRTKTQYGLQSFHSFLHGKAEYSSIWDLSLKYQGLFCPPLPQSVLVSEWENTINLYRVWPPSNYLPSAFRHTFQRVCWSRNIAENHFPKVLPALWSYSFQLCLAIQN